MEGHRPDKLNRLLVYVGRKKEKFIMSHSSIIILDLNFYYINPYRHIKSTILVFDQFCCIT